EIRRATVVLQGFGTGGLHVDAGEGDLSDFETLARGKESHVSRVVEKRIHQAALFDDQQRQARADGFDPAGETGWPCTHHEDVKYLFHSNLCLALNAPGKIPRHNSTHSARQSVQPINPGSDGGPRLQV